MRPNPIKIFFALLALTMGVVGCQPDTKACTTQGDCSTNQLCQVGACVARPASPCQKESDCQANQQCDNGKCKTPPTQPTKCTSDTNCPKATPGCEQVGVDCREWSGVFSCTQGTCQRAPGTIVKRATCPANARKCVVDGVPPTCEQDADCQAGEECQSGACKPKAPQTCPASPCPTGTSCVRGACVFSCTSESDCQTGEECQNKVCVAKPKSCKSAADCPTATPTCQQRGNDCSYAKNTYTCTQNACVAQQDALVTKDAKCTRDTQGEPVCVPLQKCSTNSGCKGSETCQNGLCITTTPTCQSDSDCGPSEACKEGLCQGAAAECGPRHPGCPDSPCINGKCVTACKEDQTCTPKGRCEAGVCVLGARCKADKDCPPEPSQCQQLGPSQRDCRQMEAPICFKGACLTHASKHIMKNARCLQTPSGGVCTPATQECATHGDCPSNRVCKKGNCERPTTVCSADSDCTLQEQCQAGTCVPGAPCQSNNDCLHENGKTCTQGICR